MSKNLRISVDKRQPRPKSNAAAPDDSPRPWPTHRPMIQQQLSEATTRAREGLSTQAFTLFQKAAMVAEGAGDSELAAQVYLTLIEELASAIPSDQLRLAYVKADELLQHSKNDLLRERLSHCAALLLAAESTAPAAASFVAEDETTAQTARQARQLAPTSATILITGPIGAGKTHLAMAIHAWSLRKGHPVILNAADAQPDEISFHLQSAPTLILEEITELSQRAQFELANRLLRRKKIPPSARLIATSTMNLDDTDDAILLPKEITNYLRSVQLTLEPLSLRSKDVVGLALHFLQPACAEHRKRVTFEPDALLMLPSLHFRENVLTLRALIERTVIDAPRHHTVITTTDMETLLARQTMAYSFADPWSNCSLDKEVMLYERFLIKLALERSAGSITKAARLLTMKHQTLDRKLRHNHRDLLTQRTPPRTRRVAGSSTRDT